MRMLQLKFLAEGTTFGYKSGTYKKGNKFKGDKVLCHPVVSGEVQTLIEKWVPLTLEVIVR